MCEPLSVLDVYKITLLTLRGWKLNEYEGMRWYKEGEFWIENVKFATDIKHNLFSLEQAHDRETENE